MGFFQTPISTAASALSYMVRAGFAVHLFQTSFFECKSTSGESMLPTLNTQWDYVHVLKSYRRGRDIQMGDVVVALKPTDPDERVLKRVTGMPGDIIIIDPSNDSIGSQSSQASFDKYIRVPEGHVWVTGDNLLYSLDSRTYSVLPMALIKGKVIAATDMNCNWREFFGTRMIENTFNELQ